MVKRARDVLQEALAFYREQNWPDQASVIEEELDSMTGKMATLEAAPATPGQTGPTVPAYPNLMFRKEFKWKGKPRD